MANHKRIFTETEKKLIIALYELNRDDKTVADTIGIPRTTLLYALKTNNMVDTVKSRKGKADERVENSLYSQAVGGDLGACIFWLKNRQPERWRDKQHLEHTGKDGGPISVRVEVVTNARDNDKGK